MRLSGWTLIFPSQKSHSDRLLETEERKRFIEESGMPDLIIIRQKPNDKVKEVALTIAKTESLSRVGMLG